MVDRQSKYWCFTINNWEAPNIALLQAFFPTHVTYIVFGEEVGERGTRHLQGYLELPRKRRLNSVITLFRPIRPHLEPRRGTAIQASDYCKKDGAFHEFGELSDPRPGRRTDLEAVQESIRTGSSIRHISEEYFATWCRYEKGIRSYFNLRAPPREWPTTVHVHWGRTGTGKTRTCHNQATEAGTTLYIHPGGAWFDGYEQQPMVLFDDFSGSCFPLPYLLKLLDRYPMQVPIKGGFVNWAPRTLFITSNIDPDIWYPRAHEEHRAALRRRFTTVTHYNGEIGRDILIVNN